VLMVALSVMSKHKVLKEFGSRRVFRCSTAGGRQSERAKPSV
jgi:hypothetical protein